MLSPPVGVPPSPRPALAALSPTCTSSSGTPTARLVVDGTDGKPGVDATGDAVAVAAAAGGAEPVATLVGIT